MNSPSVAYFTMEIALSPDIPTYSGGLGVLAGDTIRSVADLQLPIAAVSLLHRKGYFYQRLDDDGEQHELPVEWVVEDFLTETPARTTIELDGHTVHVRAWQYDVEGEDGNTVPVYLLDTNLEENDDFFRTLTDYLYGGDHYYRVCQEAILGVGGVRILRELGFHDIRRFHMNEGHASLLTIELLRETARAAGRDHVIQDDIGPVRENCVFTTHTPVEAGHDKFDLHWAANILGLGEDVLGLEHAICCGDLLNMTYLALNLSGYVNGVAKRHGEISRDMFSGYTIDSITNGVHAATWVAPSFATLFDEKIPGWRLDNFSLRSALNIDHELVWKAHTQAKASLIHRVNRDSNAGFDHDHLTLGFARRMAPYKRGALLLSDIERLKAMAREIGPIQIVYAGKAHPGDDTGKGVIHRIFEAIEELKPDVKAVYLENYDVELAKLLTTGVDVWVNTPQPPLEASGTSGMKAALNGIPSLSVLDGWWIEGHAEGVTGWAVGEYQDRGDGRDDWQADASSLYEKLERDIVPAFYNNRSAFIDIMCNCIAINGSFFNTQRMVQQYVVKAYYH